VDSMDCAGADSLHTSFTICNNFFRGSIPKGLRVSFYDADPTEANAHLLGPVFSTTEANSAKCVAYESFLNRTTTGKVFAVVNDTGRDTSGFPGNFYDEARFDNNKDTIPVIPFLVTINPADTTISRLTSVQLNPQISGGRATTFKWEPLQYLSCSDCPSPVVAPATSMQYQLTVQNEYGCTAIGNVFVKTFAGGKVSIPNGFTPNNDGHNDVFYVLGSEDVKLLKDFSVFNRWGQKVFQVENAEANDPRFGWNGFLNGKPSDPGAYVYFVTIEFTDGATQLYKGTVMLIR